MKGNCDYCPVDLVSSDLAKKAFFIIECCFCGSVFYSIGNGKTIPGWDEKRQQLLPARHNVVAFSDGANYRAWLSARKSLTRR